MDKITFTSDWIEDKKTAIQFLKWHSKNWRISNLKIFLISVIEIENWKISNLERCLISVIQIENRMISNLERSLISVIQIENWKIPKQIIDKPIHTI